VGDFRDLPGGFHKVTMTDENGCERDTTFEILAPPPIQVDDIILTHITGCSGDTTGAVTVTGSGGTGGITYAIDGGAFQGSGLFPDLPAGNHTVTLLDGNGCAVDTTVTLDEPAPVSILSAVVTPITCAGTNDGIIEVAAGGGTSPFSYILEPGGRIEPTGLFDSLAPGTYIVTVDDAGGCGPVMSDSLTLVDPPVFNLDSVVDTDITCNGDGNGSITIYISGGVPPYEYSADDQATWGPDSSFTGLAAGDYEVYARDANLCTLYGGSISVTEPPALVLDISVTHIVGCHGDTTGGIDATGSGGTGPLFYSLDGLNYQDSGVFVNLSAGSYTVYLRDSVGCEITGPADINEPDPLTAVITAIPAALGNPGSITISQTTGGTPPYQYTIDGPGGTFTSDTVYSDLVTGTYHVVVMDAGGCTIDSLVEITAVIPLDVAVSSTNVSCYGTDDGSITFIPFNAEGAVEYSIDSGVTFVPDPVFSGLPGDSTYYLMASDSAGKVFTDYIYISEPEEIILTDTITPAACNAFSETGAIDITASGGTGGFSFQWSDGSTEEDRSDLAVGTYIVVTTDNTDCSRVDTIEVDSEVIVEADAGPDTTICPGTSVQLYGQGGHTPSWSPATFLSDTGIADPVAEGVTEATTYVLTITEDSSIYRCYNTDTVVISVYPVTGIDVTEDTSIAKGTSVPLEVTGGPFFSYRWVPATGLDDSTIYNPVAMPQESVTYTVYGTNEYGCEESDSIFIEVVADLKVYNVFSPNGDGINDFFEIDNAISFPDMVVEVYNRWGDLLFQSTGYDDSSRWDGTAHGKDLPIGTYYYVIIPESGASPVTGNVTIIR